MCVQSVCYTNVIGLLHKCEWILILCLMIQCLIISENKVHGVGDTTTTLQQNQPAEAAANLTLLKTVLANDGSVGASKTHNTGIVTQSTEMLQSVDNKSSVTFHETVQPARKNISTGAFIRAFYVFVGLGAIIVMYIVVRTVR